MYESWNKELNECKLNEESRKSIIKAVRIYLKKREYIAMLFDKNIFIENPNYDMSKGIAYLANAYSNPLDIYKQALALLIISYSIKDAQILLDECLKNDSFSLQEKEVLQEYFEKIYTIAERKLHPPSYLDTFKPTELDSL